MPQRANDVRPLEGCREFRRTLSLSRRDLLRIGGAGALGLGSLPAASLGTSPSSSKKQAGHAKACILVFVWGGPSQLETWDLKPDAPAEIRGEFRPIATNVPGIQISEHFPQLAKLADWYAIIRSMTHDDPAHLSSVHHILTGRHAPKVKSDAEPPSRKDSPAIGSALARLRPTGLALPPFVTLPWIVSHPAAPGGRAPGQNAGWLGAAYDPFVVAANPDILDFAMPGLARPADLTDDRLAGRRALLAKLGGAPFPTEGSSDWTACALDLLTTGAAKQAFNLAPSPSRCATAMAAISMANVCCKRGGSSRRAFGSSA